MAQIGGSVQECSIRGRLFAAAADADVTIKLGGFSNEGPANGNGSTRMIKTREACGIEGLTLAIDHDKGDIDFLQEIARGREFVAFSITMADDTTYQGKVQVAEMLSFSTQNATIELTLIGDGEFTRQ